MFLSELMSVDQAMEIIDSHQKVMDKEIIKLENAHKRVNFNEILSQHSSPPFDKSAMDGYAIKAQDTTGYSVSNPASLVIIDSIGAGDVSKVELNQGQAVKIATGAPIPLGADAVVMEEYTYQKAGKLDVMAAMVPGENISYTGEDINKGDKVVDSGRVLRPQELAIIASAGFGEIEVYQEPIVAVIITGNELVDPTPILEDAKIINSNQYALKAMVESTNARVDVFHCRDDLELMENTLLRVIDDYDVVITTGGTAISKGDVVVDAVNNLGEVFLHGVAIRPGKPVAFGIINDKPIFMLSGYPVAAMVQFDVFVRTYLLKMQNISFKNKLVKRISTKKVPSNLGRTDYIRAIASENEVKPILSKGSGVIRSMVDSNCYLVIPENQEGCGEGDECEVILFDSFNI
ncbi:gephyrin-like molybdotransferase Glp [Methanobacterium alcaliphilum]|uniref:molybdopterin molybdotransferase MoeA n=1 Tax=Methanobacterium alcaliphilum TaxID=392018 RepID=UPI00200A56F6|nr:gephyrin-like molybdotransferase Glp [Methanobacterium alcaliphilum]MCK9151089.1 molybdopterin molybdotransferase MoeA [Methanobacterium alcaliphilum]